VRFEVTDQTRQAIDEHLRLAGLKPGQFLFPGRRNASRGMTTREYARLVREWVSSIGLNASQFGTHSLRSSTFAWTSTSGKRSALPVRVGRARRLCFIP